MSNISQWSTTPGSNNDTPPDGAPEGMAPSGVNDVIRENMAATAKWYGDTDGSLVSTGSANAYVLTTNSGHAALADQSMLVFRANFANTGAATLAVDGLTAKSVKKNHDVDLASGDIALNQIVVVSYNATDDVYEMVSQAASVPTGAMLDYAGSGSVPSGWLLCDGSDVSRTTHAALFAAIGTTWGAGDGSTTFTLPDTRRRVSVGSGGTGTGTLGNAVGDTGGEEAHTLTSAEMEHAHIFDIPGGTNIQSGSNLTNTGVTTGPIDSDSASAHNVMQPSYVVQKIIKT